MSQAQKESVSVTALTKTGVGRAGKLPNLIGAAIFYSLLALLVLVAIPYGTVEPWWEALFECLVFALGALWMVEGMLSGRWLIPEHKVFLPILLLAVYAFVQTLPIIPGDASTGGLKVWRAISADPYETRLSVLKLSALLLCGAMLLRYGQSRGRLRALVFTLILVGLLSALFGILRQTTQHAPGFFLPFLKPDTGYGQFINRNSFAYLMEMSLGLTLGLVVARGVRREQVLIYLALALPLWVALILCNSRGGVLSMLAEVIFLAILFIFARPRKRSLEGDEASFFWRVAQTKIFGAALILVLVATVFLGALWVGGESLTSRLETVSSEMAAETGAGSEGAGRKEIWRASMALIKDHPLMGVGFNGYWAAIPQYHEASGSLTPQQAHNDYLELLASGGIIGVGLAAWFLFLFVKAVRRSFRSANTFGRAASMAACVGLCGVMVHSVVDFGLHVTINALVFTALIVVALSGGIIFTTEDTEEHRGK